MARFRVVASLWAWLAPMSALATAVEAPNSRQEPSNLPHPAESWWHLRLAPPLLGAGRGFAARTVGGNRDAWHAQLLGATLSREWTSRSGRLWLVEGELSLWAADVYVKPRAALRAGRIWRLLDTRGPNGRGSTLSLLGMAGLVGCGPAYDWLHSSGSEDQRSLGLQAQGALEGVRFLSAGFGLLARLRAGGSYFPLRAGERTWTSESATVVDDTVALLDAVFELGVAW